jgi:hypothetical protein
MQMTYKESLDTQITSLNALLEIVGSDLGEEHGIEMVSWNRDLIRKTRKLRDDLVKEREELDDTRT